MTVETDIVNNELLLCYICHQTCKSDPVAMTCRAQHVFCFSCIFQYFSTAGNSVNCPTCRFGTGTIVVMNRIKKIVDQLEGGDNREEEGKDSGDEDEGVKSDEYYEMLPWLKERFHTKFRYTYGSSIITNTQMKLFVFNYRSLNELKKQKEEDGEADLNSVLWYDGNGCILPRRLPSLFLARVRDGTSNVYRPDPHPEPNPDPLIELQSPRSPPTPSPSSSVSVSDDDQESDFSASSQDDSQSTETNDPGEVPRVRVRRRRLMSTTNLPVYNLRERHSNSRMMREWPQKCFLVLCVLQGSGSRIFRVSSSLSSARSYMTGRRSSISAGAIFCVKLSPNDESMMDSIQDIAIPLEKVGNGGQYVSLLTPVDDRKTIISFLLDEFPLQTMTRESTHVFIYEIRRIYRNGSLNSLMCQEIRI